jgi:tetratricopeptide (TPR) repeat protein
MALPRLVRALELDPSPQIYWITVNSAITSLDSFRGRSSDDMQYQTTIESLQPELVRKWQAAGRNNLGLAYEYLGDLKQARTAFAMAASIDPGLDLAWFNLAVVCTRQKDRPAFETARARLTALNPERAARLLPLMPHP